MFWVLAFFNGCLVTLVVSVWVLGSMSALAAFLLSFFNSLTLSLYLRVFNVCSQHPLAGEMLAIITVLHLCPVNESFNTWVSLLPLNGVCFFSWSSARIHSFSASKLLLISAPSILVYFPVSEVSAPLSLPARSMKLIFPNILPLWSHKLICNIACDLELSMLAAVDPVVLASKP